MKALIVGNGGVGKAYALAFRQQLGGEASFYQGRQANNTFCQELIASDILVNTMTSKGKGEEAMAYNLKACRIGKPIAMSEKCSIAHHAEKLLPFMHNIRFTASAGGGSRILRLIDETKAPIARMVGIVNGSLNSWFWGSEIGETPEESWHRMQISGHLEKGCTSWTDAFNLELQDATKKCCILFLKARLGIITPDLFGYMAYSDTVIRDFLSMGNGTRFVVTIKKSDFRRLAKEAFLCYREPWLITGEFVPNASSHFDNLSIDYARNALIIETEDGKRSKLATGLGAGLEPTAQVMIEDTKELLGIV